MVNVLAKVPKAAQQAVATLVRSVFAQPDAESTHAQFEQVLEHLESRFPEAAELLADAREELLAFTAFPKAVWRQVWSNNPLERLNKEVRRRTDVVGIFPNRAALIDGTWSSPCPRGWASLGLKGGRVGEGDGRLLFFGQVGEKASSSQRFQCQRTEQPTQSTENDVADDGFRRNRSAAAA